jgi:hypothetical protein
MKKTLITLALLGATLSGCDWSKEYRPIESRQERVERANESLATRINERAVYGTFNGRVMDYKTFVEITGIPKEIPSRYENAPVWIEVSDLPGLRQNANTIEESTRVRIDLPDTLAMSVLSKLEEYKNKSYGITPLTDKDFENLPAGGY